MKKLAVGVSLLLCNLYADVNVTINSGWGLYGTAGAVDDVTETLSNSNINTVWAYGESGWKAYSPDTVMSNTLTNANIDKLSSMNHNVGFWINAKNPNFY